MNNLAKVLPSVREAQSDLQEFDNAYHDIVRSGQSPDEFLPAMKQEYKQLLDSGLAHEMADLRMDNQYGRIWIALRETIWLHADEGER